MLWEWGIGSSDYIAALAVHILAVELDWGSRQHVLCVPYLWLEWDLRMSQSYKGKLSGGREGS